MLEWRIKLRFIEGSVGAGLAETVYESNGGGVCDSVWLLGRDTRTRLPHGGAEPRGLWRMFICGAGRARVFLVELSIGFARWDG